MYLPAHFREDDLAAIQAFVTNARLATLVSAGEGGLRASHVPILFDAQPEPYGTLRCHLARANPQWRDLEAGGETLVVILGPDAYVSPSAYASKAEHGKVVPTWDYVAVHAYGIAAVFHDASELHELVRHLTDLREGPRAKPWSVDDAPPAYVASQLRAIVGVTIPVARFEAKAKLSQNRDAADMAGVVASLAQSPLPVEREVAELVAERLARKSRPA